MPKLCNYNVLVKQIVCGEAHTHILSQDGFVYSMGINHYGVLGLGVNDMKLSNVTEPQLITTLSSIAQLATGRAHSLALAADRKIYAWGR
jgi:X-linked retinitis pigmentosa GTPase regulator